MPAGSCLAGPSLTSMEAATASTLQARSVSLTTARFRRSRTATRLPSPQLPAASSLRRARSDAHVASPFAASAVLLRHSPILEADDGHQEEVLAGVNGGAGQGGTGGRGGNRRGGGQGSGCDMGEYYRRVLRADPENPLLLRNYGKYLHEVEGDLAAAEGCYARALLACPADADLLSLYARVIWEARQEKERAAAYFQRAVQAAPDDCYVLGSYASFLWDAGEEEAAAADVKKKEETSTVVAALAPAC